MVRTRTTKDVITRLREAKYKLLERKTNTLYVFKQNTSNCEWDEHGIQLLQNLECGKVDV